MAKKSGKRCAPGKPRGGMSSEEKRQAMTNARKKVLGLCLVGLLLAGVALGAGVTPPSSFKSNPNRVNNREGSRVYDLGMLTRETVDVAETAAPAYATVTRWIPWMIQGADTLGYRAMYVKAVALQGDGIHIRAFGPGLSTPAVSSVLRVSEDIISASPDSVAVETSFPTPVDSLWLWDVSGTTGRVRLVAF